MLGAKPKAFEYPRPVSPVCADEIPLRDDTTVYYDLNGDGAEVIGDRAAKRRRIESQATAYLRGQPLFILSAQLRGPFTNGWQNPWSQKRSSKPKQTTKQQLDNPSMLAQEHAATSPASSSVKQRTEESCADADTRPKPQTQDDTTRKGQLPANPTAPNRGGRKVEDWLRRNKASRNRRQRSPSGLPISPSKTSMPISTKWESAPMDMDYFPRVDSIVDVADLELRESNASVLRQFKELQKKLPAALSSLAPERKSEHVGFEFPPEPEQTSKQTSRFGTNEENKSTADGPVLSPRNNAGHSASPATMSSTDLGLNKAGEHEPHSDQSHLRFKSQSDAVGMAGTGKGKGVSEIVSNSDSPSHHIAQEAPSLRKTEITIPSFSKEPSKASSISDLPSAQVPSHPILQSAPSNLSSNAPLLPVPLNQVSEENSEVEQIDQSLGMGILDLAACNGIEPACRQQASPSARNISRTERNPIEVTVGEDQRNLIEQEGPASPTPLTPATITKLPSHDDAEPSMTHKSVTKERELRGKKRATFVTDESSSASSQGSIKSALRVAKGCVASQYKGAVLKATLPSADDENQRRTTRQILSSNGGSVLPVTRTSQGPKGILKSTSGQASTNGIGVSTNGASSSTKQDAQRQQKLDLIESIEDVLYDYDDANFDANGAMDELGVFLGSWEAEKEALVTLQASG